MSSPFTLSQVADGVWSAVSPPFEMPTVSNAGIVDLGDRTVVFDSFMTVEAATALAETAEELTGRPPDLLVNSHHHSDHVGGNAVFAGVPRFGTERMCELITGDVPKPDTLIVSPVQLAGSERRVVVLPLGAGHTDSDIIVHVPDSGVLLSGDLVWNGLHPKTSDGYPAGWVDSLRSMQALGAGIVVAGHGDNGGPGLIEVMIRYMEALGTMVDDARGGSLVVAEADPPDGTDGWIGPDRFRAGLEAIAARD